MMSTFYLGIQTKYNGGFFTNGKEYSTLKNVEIEVVYWRIFVKLGKSPSKQRLAGEAKVGNARKLANEGKKRWRNHPCQEAEGQPDQAEG